MEGRYSVGLVRREGEGGCGDEAFMFVYSQSQGARSNKQNEEGTPVPRLPSKGPLMDPPHSRP